MTNFHTTDMSNQKQPPEELLSSMASILIPKEYLEHFEVSNIEEKLTEWVITLKEKEDRVPQILFGKASVLDGYCDPVSILTHAFSLKKIYLQIYRRRWKEPGSATHYSNSYDLHIAGMKTTKEFGAFLKEISR